MPVPSIIEHAPLPGLDATADERVRLRPRRRVAIRISDIAMSAVASVSTPGVLVAIDATARVQAGTSMLL